MKITFHGAAGGEVTGSAYRVQTRNARVLVDCGMFQGGRESAAKNRPPAAARGRGPGEDGPRKELARKIQQRHGLKPVLPLPGDVVEI